MNAPLTWGRILVAVGLVGMLIGVVDPLEGSFVILPATVLAAAGAALGKSRWRKLLYWSVALVAFGVVAMVVLSCLGGIGGHSGRSLGWGVFMLPYPVGWLTGLVGTVLALIEFYKHPTPTRSATS